MRSSIWRCRTSALTQFAVTSRMSSASDVLAHGAQGGTGGGEVGASRGPAGRGRCRNGGQGRARCCLRRVSRRLRSAADRRTEPTGFRAVGGSRPGGGRRGDSAAGAGRQRIRARQYGGGAFRSSAKVTRRGGRAVLRGRDVPRGPERSTAQVTGLDVPATAHRRSPVGPLLHDAPRRRDVLGVSLTALAVLCALVRFAIRRWSTEQAGRRAGTDLYGHRHLVALPRPIRPSRRCSSFRRLAPADRLKVAFLVGQRAAPRPPRASLASSVPGTPDAARPWCSPGPPCARSAPRCGSNRSSRRSSSGRSISPSPASSCGTWPGRGPSARASPSASPRASS